MKLEVISIYQIFKEIRETTRQILYIHKIQRKRVIFVSVLSVILCCLLFVPSILYSKMLDYIFITKSATISYWFAGILLLFYLVIQMISAIKDVYCNKIRNVITSTVSNKINRNMLNSQNEKIDLPYIKNLFERDLPVMEDFIRNYFCEFVTNFCVVIISFPILLWINCWVTVGLCILVILLMGVNYILSKKEQDVTYKIIKLEDRISNFKLEALKEWFCIKNFNMQNSYSNSYNNLVDTHIQLRNKWLVYWQSTLSYIDIKKNFISNALIYLLGGILVKRNLLSVAKLLIFVQIFLLWYEALEKLLSIVLSIMVNQPSYERVIQSLEKRRKEPSGTREIKKHNVVLEHISFRYGDSRYDILQDISCTFAENSVNVITGENGIGKSTLTKIISGQIKVERGDILFGDENIREINQDLFHENIANVSQNCTLFNVSLYENIKMLNPKISREEIYELLNKVGLNDWALQLPNQLDTIVGEGGVNLSGGQLQRISILQAIVRNATIILMDEPSSALDTMSEKMIIDFIQEYKKEKTFIIVTHSQNLIDCADHKFNLKEGRLIKEDE